MEWAWPVPEYSTAEWSGPGPVPEYSTAEWSGSGQYHKRNDVGGKYSSQQYITQLPAEKSYNMLYRLFLNC